MFASIKTRWSIEFFSWSFYFSTAGWCCTIDACLLQAPANIWSHKTKSRGRPNFQIIQERVLSGIFEFT